MPPESAIEGIFLGISLVLFALGLAGLIAVSILLFDSDWVNYGANIDLKRGKEK